MKYFLVSILTLGLIFMQCKKEDSVCQEDLQSATIIGIDARLCPCCGGWFIDLGQDTIRAFELPAGFEINPETDLPLEVCLSYQEVTGPCQDFGRLVVVDEIID